MTNRVWLGVLVGAVLGTTACKSESARQAEQAAREVTEQREDLQEAQQDLAEEREDLGQAETPEAIASEKADLIDESVDVVKEAGELAAAQTAFEQRKALRIQVVRAEHEVIATQPMLISTMARYFPLTDAGRADVNEKLTTFQRRLDEAANLIQGLQNADASVWTKLDEDTTEAMKRLDDARANAWQALDDAPKADPNAT